MKDIWDILKKGKFSTILINYIRNHVFLLVIIALLVLGRDRNSLEIIRQTVENKVYRRLRKKYRKYAIDIKYDLDKRNMGETVGSNIWICWFQGVENAPDIVKLCIESIKKNVKNKKVIILDSKNYKNYVKFPKYIDKKIESGVITKTHLSDLLRMELLTTYGGTWIDATVLCTGDENISELLDNKLFMFQILKPGLDGHSLRVSSWFINSWSNNKILLLAKELLYKYWQENDYMYDYFLLHDFIELAIELYPNIWEKVPPYSSSIPHLLQLRLFKKYDEKIFNTIVRQTNFHKLTYKFGKEETMKDETYYKKIYSMNKRIF